MRAANLGLRLLVIGFAPFLMASEAYYEAVFGRYSGEASTIVRQLQAGAKHEAAMSLHLPRSVTSTERAELEATIAQLLRRFGVPNDVRRAQTVAATLNLSVAGGPGPTWWTKERGYLETRQYVYAVEFAHYGPGYLRVLTSLRTAGEVPVVVSFSLPKTAPLAQERVEEVLEELLHASGSDAPAAIP